MLKKIKSIISLLLCAAMMVSTVCIGGFATTLVSAEGGEETLPDYNVKRYIPEYNEVQVLIDGDAVTEGDLAEYKYCAFPTKVIQKSENEIMFSYSRSVSHVGTDGVFELVTFNTKTNEITDTQVLYSNGVDRCNHSIFELPDGSLMDVMTRYTPTLPTEFLPAYIMRSTDGGETWAFDDPTHADDTYKTLEDTDGVQYFYAINHLIEGETLYMTTTTYASATPTFRGNGVRSDNGNLIKTEDNGKTWEFVLNFTDMLGEQISEECTIDPLPDGGYLFICRGANNVFAMTTDENFNLVKKRNLTTDCPEQFGPWIGLPNVFIEDGKYYLYCRNVPEAGVEELAFYELDVENLLPKSYVVLEEPMTSNWGGSGAGGDGHYAKHYFTERDGVRYINFISYTNAYTFNPDIIRIECRWDEISNPVYDEETDTVETVYPVKSTVSHTDSTTPVYDGELANFSAAFEYAPKADANWYFDVVDGDYNNCYNLALTPDGFTLNRVVGGESSVLATYTDIDKNRYYYPLELVRYMGEITLYSDGEALLTVASEDIAYPVTETGNDTHWKGYIYLDDAEKAISDIKIYDSGLITFTGGKAILGTVPLREDIGVMHTVAATSATVTPDTDKIKVGVAGNNPAVYTEKWLDKDMGDCVITYNARLFDTYTTHAFYFGAQASETPTGGQWFLAENNASDFKTVFNFADGILFGRSTANSSERFVSVTEAGSWSDKVAATKHSTAWGRYEVKIVKKAGKIKVTIGNVLSSHTLYEGDATAIAGNIYFALFQRHTTIQDIKITDTEKTGKETVTAALPVASKNTYTDSTTPIYANTLSNFSADFGYNAENNATLYFDVVNADYNNCYALKLTPSGLSLDRVVAGTASTLCSYTGNTAGTIQVIRYMGEITVFIDEIPVMAVADEDIAYPVTSTGANTHWYGNIYLDDETAAVSDIKIYDSGLVTFKGGVPIVGDIKLTDNITTYVVSPNTDYSISSTENGVYMSIGGTNKAIHTTKWLDEDVGDFVLTYTDCNARHNWTNKAIEFTATPAAAGAGSWGEVFYAYDANQCNISWNYDYGDIFVTGVAADGTNTFYKVVEVNSRGSFSNKKTPTDTGMLYGTGVTYNVKIVKKAERLTILMGTSADNMTVMYDGTSDNVAGNIFYSQFQGSADIKNIKITDTVNTYDGEITLKEEELLVGDLSGDDSVNATDLTLMRKKLLGLDVDVDICKKADVNTDRYLDIRDMIRLKKNLAN